MQYINVTYDFIVTIMIMINCVKDMTIILLLCLKLVGLSQTQSEETTVRGAADIGNTPSHSLSLPMMVLSERKPEKRFSNIKRIYKYFLMMVDDNA